MLSVRPEKGHILAISIRSTSSMLYIHIYTYPTSLKKILIMTIEYDKAEELFDQIRQENPYRLEDMDIYSNLLYLQGSKEKLSMLAHDCIQIDQYQPETCCIVGKKTKKQKKVSLLIFRFFKNNMILTKTENYIYISQLS